MESPAEVLLIDPDADEAEIERAYRRRVKEVHPDQGGSMEEFLRVRAAYEHLRAGNGDARLETGESSTEDTGRSDHGGGSTHGGSKAGSSDRRETVRPEVEYLNYEVIEDHSWELTDDDLFEKAADAGLGPPDYGRIEVEPDGPLLEGVEQRGQTWPFSCRGGACANCAVAVTDGEVSMPSNHVLPQEMLDRGIRLSCIGKPVSETLQVVYNVKHLPGLDELRLPPRPFEQALDD